MPTLSSILPPVSLTSASGTLPVGNGGTGATTLTANNVLLGNGTSAVQVVAPGTSGNVLTSNGTTWTSTAAPGGPTLTAVASGSLSDGSRVIINADGTVSVVASNSSSIGTAAVYNSGSNIFVAASYDQVSRKVVIAYKNTSSTYGTAVVGTVSGTSISFGTPVVFYSNATNNIKIINLTTGQRFVIAFTDVSNTNQGVVIALKVTENSITFGARVSFNASTATYDFGLTHDKANDRVIVAYVNTGNSNFGTALSYTVSDMTITSVGSPVVFNSAFSSYVTATYNDASQNTLIIYSLTAKVATLTPTSINFGAAATISGVADATAPSATYDSVSQRVVLAYANAGNSNYGTAVVGTVSGTTVSFGTPVVFHSGTIFYNGMAATYDAASQRVVIAYRDTNNGSFGTVIAGTVSGSSISFATPVVFNAAVSNEIGITYSPVDQRVVIAYANNANSGFGTGITFRAIDTNLTSENFIGFSSAAYTNGQTATIQIVGSVDDAQSGLTPGQSYFVQNNGTLGLAPANIFAPVFAGTAVAATKIIVKG